MNARSAARRYTAVTFLTWFPTGLYLAPMVLLMIERGLSVPTIATVTLIFSVTTAMLELPTGGLADVIGRRGVLAAAAVASFLGLVLLGLAETFWLFAAASVLRGVARALSSGPAQAWYVDTVHLADGADADLTPGLARGEAATSIGLAAGTLIGGAIPAVVGAVGPLPALAIPVLCGALLEIVRLVVALVAMPEPPHAQPSLRTVLVGVPKTVGTGLRLGLRDAVLARVLLAAGGLGCALFTIELLTPAWLAELTGDRERGSTVYAAIAAAGFFASALGNVVSPWVKRRLGTPVRTAAFGLGVGALALLGVAVAGPGLDDAATGIPVVAAAYLLMFVGLGVTSAPYLEVIHRRVSAAERATILSVDSLMLQLVGSLGGLVLGRLAGLWGTAPAFGLAGVVLLLSALLVARSSRRSWADRADMPETELDGSKIDEPATGIAERTTG